MNTRLRNAGWRKKRVPIRGRVTPNGSPETINKPTVVRRRAAPGETSIREKKKLTKKPNNNKNNEKKNYNNNNDNDVRKALRDLEQHGKLLTDITRALGHSCAATGTARKVYDHSCISSAGSIAVQIQISII